MKKSFVTAAALVLLISLAGCAEQTPPYDDTENPSQPESSASQQTPVVPEPDSTSSFLAGEESENPVVSEDLGPEQPPINSQPSEETQRFKEAPAPKQEETKPPVSQQPQPTPPLASQPEQRPDPPASESEAPLTPIEPEPAVFDVTPYVQSAKEYGAGIGLALDSVATACWDDPLTTNARCRYLERDLRDRLDWYKVSGITAFWVWAEQTGSGEYLIYIGYA